MIAGLDTASPPTDAQLETAKANGVRLWSGYIRTVPLSVGHIAKWEKADFDRVKRHGLLSIAYCSGHDDPVACRNAARDFGVHLLCLDVEDGIRSNGDWVQDWLDKSGAGLYGHIDVHAGRRAAFHVLTRFVNSSNDLGDDPKATWRAADPRPKPPCGWQWIEDSNPKNEYRADVDRCWFDDWFATGTADRWVSTGGSFKRDPVVAQNKDGRLELMAVGEDGHLRDLFQSAPGVWSATWVDLGQPPGGAPGSPALGRTKDGCISVLLRGANGKVFQREQKGPGGALSAFAPLGGDPRKRDPVVLAKAGGHLQAFVVGDDGHLCTLEQSPPDGAWGTTWDDLGGPPPGGAAGRLVVRQNANGRLELILRGTNGKIFHRTQQAGGALAAWAELPGDPRHNDPVAAQNQDGRLQAFVIGDDGHLFDIAQARPNGPWAAQWTDRGGPPPSKPAGRLALARNNDGRIELFVRGADGKLYHRAQKAANGALAPAWTPLGGSLAGNPVVGRNKDGRLEVFAVGKDGAIYRAAQTAPGRWA